jgi:hypothetical protein
MAAQNAEKYGNDSTQDIVNNLVSPEPLSAQLVFQPAQSTWGGHTMELCFLKPAGHRLSIPHLCCGQLSIPITNLLKLKY